jgi:hypothetical protein
MTFQRDHLKEESNHGLTFPANALLLDAAAAAASSSAAIG